MGQSLVAKPTLATPTTHTPVVTKGDIQNTLKQAGYEFDGIVICRLNDHPIPSFSFTSMRGRLSFPTIAELKLARETHPFESFIKSQYFELSTDAPRATAQQVAKFLDQLFEGSIYFANYLSDQASGIIAKINRLAREHDFTTEKLANFLAQRTKLPLAAAHIDTKGTLHSSHAFFKDRFTSSEFRFRLREARHKGQPLILEAHDMRFLFCALKPDYLDHLQCTEFLIAARENQFHQREIDFITKCANAFFTTRYMHHRYQMIATMQDKALQNAQRNGIATRQQIQELLRDHCRTCAKIIVSNLPADSVTVRFFDCETNTLDIFVEEISRWGEAVDRSSRKGISTSRRAESVNAFVFATQAVWHDGVYLPRMNSVPTEYKHLGLNHAYARRPQTRSEYCLPIIFGTEPIATLNVESRFEDAFSEEDRLSIRIIKNSVETLIRNTYFENDAYWLARQGFVSLSIHELEQTLSTDSLFTEEQKNYLEDYVLGPQKTLVRGGRKPVSSLGRELKQRLSKQPYDRFTRELMSNVVTVSNSIRAKQITRHNYQLLFSLISNLLDNTGNYGDVRRDKIIVSEISGSPDEDAVRLKIRWKTFGAEDQDVWQRVTVSPITSDLDNEIHFGMFFVGLAARQLGGFAFVSGDPRKGSKTIEVRVRA